MSDELANDADETDETGTSVIDDEDFAEDPENIADHGSTAAEVGPEPEPVIEILIEGPQPAPLISGKVDRQGVAIGTGRRKTAVARVRITSGQGKFTVNGREMDDYFPLERDRQMIMAPLKATKNDGQVDIWVRVNGGGPTGQTGAVVLGVARALEARNNELHATLSEGGYLTRDGRMVERKKYGRRKARRSFQFSKR